jgi:hypothetical protein
MTGQESPQAIGELRAAVAGLVGFAAVEEQVLLTAAPAGERGTPDRWPAVAVIAHNTEFRQQQVSRLKAVAKDQVPPEFAEIDHASAEIYRGYAGHAPADAAADAWDSTGALLAALASVSDQDLTDPGRNPWLRGRQLWLQVVVRGFWHPTGHLGEYYLSHGQPERALGLATRGGAAATAFSSPAPARGMAWYNLACAQAASGLEDEAIGALGAAVASNPDVRANAGEEPALDCLLRSGRLSGILTSAP